MTFTGQIQNGVVVFDGPVDLPDGTVVRVEAVPAADSSHPRSSRMELYGPILGAIKDLPADASSRVDHYLYDQPEE